MKNLIIGVLLFAAGYFTSEQMMKQREKAIEDKIGFDQEVLKTTQGAEKEDADLCKKT